MLALEKWWLKRFTETTDWGILCKTQFRTFKSETLFKRANQVINCWVEAGVMRVEHKTGRYYVVINQKKLNELP